jgi:hypothetical protein
MAKSTSRRRRPAMTPEGREDQLISLAFDVAEKQMEAGTASSQVLTHFLKLGTTREKLEQQKLQNENLLIAARIEQMASTERIEAMYEEALKAMRTYSGDELESFDDDFFDG